MNIDFSDTLAILGMGLVGALLGTAVTELLGLLPNLIIMTIFGASSGYIYGNWKYGLPRNSQ